MGRYFMIGCIVGNFVKHFFLKVCDMAFTTIQFSPNISHTSFLPKHCDITRARYVLLKSSKSYFYKTGHYLEKG